MGKIFMNALDAQIRATAVLIPRNIHCQSGVHCAFCDPEGKP